MTKEKPKQKYLPIEDYGVIGNLQTAALVSLYGSIDFMCFPRFDSPTVFCRLLDAKKGGFFSIVPRMKDMVSKQLYLPDTNILVTRFFAEEGIAEIIDYMPVSDEEAYGAVIRKISTVRGTVRYKMHCSPAFNYGSVSHTIRHTREGCLFIPEKPIQPSLWLISDIPFKADGKEAKATFTLEENESASFVLETDENKQQRLPAIEDYVASTYKETIAWWQNWIARTVYDGHWEEMVRRSALTLKLLTSAKHGSMVAAPTFSLPEQIGGERNWDYRYTWIRDAAFSMHAFLELGFLEEASRFLDWLKEQSTKSELQLMFAVDGKMKLEEIILDSLEGYKKSAPVRIGNNAYKQTQMDIYGELLETLYIYSKHGGDITYEYWQVIMEYIDYVIKNWQKPDHSIWEVRGAKRAFLFSRIMCWVALDRAIRIGDSFSFPYDALQWQKVRNEIYIDVYENFWNEEKQAFVQYKGADSLDASALLMPILNMISPHAEKWQKTMDAIYTELRSDVLIYRYREDTENIDGLKGKEGAFAMCSFWYVECLALSGQTEAAREQFEKLLGYANHLGLFSEQIGTKGEHLGNFPQAFTHLALISAAIELSKRLDTGKTQQLRRSDKDAK